MKLALARIAEMINAGGWFDPNATAEGYSIDSRTVAPGELFFAVRGERLDGHDFVLAALEKGAIAAVIARGQEHRYPHTAKLLFVPDTLLALQALGASVRRIWAKPLIGVTGSAGKTTTKEAIAHVLSSRFNVFKSQGNLNNHFGLPLQLLKLEPARDIAVVEMGMSHAGEIAALAKIAQPEIGVVTLVAPVHLEFFASIADVARAKYELIASLPKGGVAVLNADDPYVSQFGRDFHGRVVTFGIEHPAGVRAEGITSSGESGSQFTLVANGERSPAVLPLLGRHNIYNALAAVAVALDRGMGLRDAAQALATLHPIENRGQLLQLDGATVINDCYNSNPKALDAMVDALAEFPAQRRVAVVGEMLELGPTAPVLHEACGRHMAAKKIDFVLGVRGLAAEIVKGARVAGVTAEFVATPEEAGDWLAREVRSGDAILLKASRGVRLERALEAWKAANKSAARGS